MSLSICLAASEFAPFAKTGGLGDVAAALSEHLHRQGHDVRPFLPLYASLDRQDYEFTPVSFLQGIPLEMGRFSLEFSVFTTVLESGLTVYFIHCPALYGRKEIYSGEWDESLRFAALSRAIIESCQRMGWGPQLFHCNDWHTSLIPIYLRTVYAWDRLFEDSRTVLTLHNLGFQGVFPSQVLSDLQLDAHQELFFQEDLKAGRVNFLKTGLLYSSVVTTVSRSYAQEIQASEQGRGLEGLLYQRRDSLVGIVNGVDYDQWSPEKDTLIPSNYSADDLEGKAENKRALMSAMGLEEDRDTPLLAVVSRLTHQKGFDLLFDTLAPVIASGRAKLVVLGSGEKRYAEFFHWLAERFPQRAAFHEGYSNELAHKIEAGADIFLMPSRYEPCGLNQMYSLRYGTVPLVRKTGGLADTVELYDPEKDTGTGFVFEHLTPSGMAWALDFALRTFHDSPDAWRRLQLRGMAKDYSWHRQGQLYEDLYRKIVA